MKANARCTQFLYEQKKKYTNTRAAAAIGEQLESDLYFTGNLVHVQKEENTYKGAAVSFDMESAHKGKLYFTVINI